MPAKKKTSKAKQAATKKKASTAAAPAAKKKAAKGTAKKATAKKATAAASKVAKGKEAADAKKASAGKKAAAAKKAPAAKKAAPAASKAKKVSVQQAPAAAAKKAKKTAVSQQASEPIASKAKKAPVAKKAASSERAAEPTAKAKKTASAPQSEPASNGGATDYDAAIARIEAKATAAGVRLAEGASAKAIKAAEKALGLSLPEEVVAFYRRHDGAEDEPAVEGRELLSLQRMVAEWKIWKDLLDQGTFEENDHGRPGPGVQQRWWIPEWVPVTYDGAGNHHVIDLAPAPSGTHGQILSFWHDDDARTVVAKGFLAWLEGTTWGPSDEDAGDDDDEAADEEDDEDDDEAVGEFRRFEMAQKFWSIRLDGDAYTVRFGKLGTDGQEQTKFFEDEDEARQQHDELVAAKLKKGYREV